MDTSSAHRRQVVAQVYDAGAAAYDRYWAPALLRHSTELVRTVRDALPHPDDGTTPGRTVVDIAAGTGRLLPDLKRLAGPGGTVVALDLSLGMLRRIPGAPPRAQADACALPLASGSADAVVLAFVLFMLPDARTAVLEAARVLRPGGYLMAATWGAQQGSDADAVIREELDAAGAPPVPDVPRSDSLTSSPERMAALLGDWFEGVRCRPRPLGARFDAGTALALRTGASMSGWRFRQLDPDRRDRVAHRAAERLAGLPPQAFADDSEVLLTTARRR